MYVNLDEILPVSVTLVNRLDAKDGDGKKDTLHVTFIDAAQWNLATEATMGDTTLDIGQMFKVQLPKATEVERNGQTVTLPYMEYQTWKTDPTAGYTCRAGDVIIKGAVAEAITPESLRDIEGTYAPNVCNVRTVDDKTTGMGISSTIKTGALRFLEFVAVEGV